MLSAGASVCALSGPLHGHLLVAATAGVAVGLAADALLVARPTVPRPLSPGQRFDWAALRLLDGLRAMAGYDLLLVFWPERAEEISVWAARLKQLLSPFGAQVEPISARGLGFEG